MLGHPNSPRTVASPIEINYDRPQAYHQEGQWRVQGGERLLFLLWARCCPHFGRPDIQYDALAALEAIAAEPEFTVPVGESVWARLIAIGKPLAEADIQALDILFSRYADGT